MKKSFLLAPLLLILLTGCSIGTTKKPTTPVNTNPVVGTYKSGDNGDTWVPKVGLYTADGTKKTMATVDIKMLKYDPQDLNTLYLATDHGIFYSYNRGEGWFQTLSSKGIVNDIAIDPHASCTIYAAVHGEVYKTTNCARSWEKIHFSSITDEYYTSIFVSNADSNTVLVATSKGKLERSLNAGRSWDLITIFKAPIIRFVAESREKNSFYIVQKNDIQKTEDGGVTFLSLLGLPVHNADNTPQVDRNQKPILLLKINGASTFYDLKIDASADRGLIYASAYGIFRLAENGTYWLEIGTLIKPREQTIYAVDVNGHNGQDIYFTTVGALYRSVNGGQDWALRTLPSTGFPKFLELADDNDHELVIGFTAPPQKK